MRCLLSHCRVLAFATFYTQSFVEENFSPNETNFLWHNVCFHPGPVWQSFLFELSDSLTHILLSVSGYYAYAEADRTRDEGDESYLRSPTYENLNNSENCNVSFYYHMYGIDVGGLEVFVRNAQRGSDIRSLFKRQGDQGDAWRQGFITVPGDLDRFQVGHDLVFCQRPFYNACLFRQSYSRVLWWQK